MEPNHTGQEYTTYASRLFREKYPEIRSLFGSALGVRILYLLKDGARSPFDLSETTGSSMPVLLTEINALMRENLVERVRNEYALTNSARIVASQAAAFAATVGMPASGRVRKCAEPEPAYEHGSSDECTDVGATIRAFYCARTVAGSLLALSDGKKTLSELSAVAGCMSDALIPRIRWLEAMGLLREEDGYVLTPAGERVAAEMEQFTATFAAVMRHRDFWNTHGLDRFPDFALHAFGDLADAEIIRDNQTNYLLNYEHYASLLAKAAHIHGLSTMANPSISDIITVRVAAGVPVELVISPTLADRIRRDPYREKIALLSTFEHMRFRVTELPIPMGMTVTDRCMSAKLFVRDGDTYDMQNGLFCTSPKAIDWGERLFAYYKEHSVPMEEYVRFAGRMPEDR